MPMTQANTRTVRDIDIRKESIVHEDLGIAVYEGGFYALATATGLVALPTNGAGQLSLGWARSSAASGFPPPLFEYGHQELVTFSAVATDVGKALYATSDNAFTTTAGSATTPVGIIREIHSSTQCWVDTTLKA